MRGVGGTCLYLGKGDLSRPLAATVVMNSSIVIMSMAGGTGAGDVGWVGGEGVSGWRSMRGVGCGCENM